MRKIITCILLISLVFSLTACVGNISDTQLTEPKEENEHMLDNKKVIILGNSYVFYGKTVLTKSSSAPQQRQRVDDQGYFYQLCKEMGAEVAVTNWTFGGHSVRRLFEENCYYCNLDHRTFLVDRYYDYVVVSPGSEYEFGDTMETIMAFFREANPDVKFVILGNHAPLGYTRYENLEYIWDLYAEFEKQGVIIADWGGLFHNIITGQYTVPEATQTYTRNTFLVATDNYHPNLLTGYLEAMVLYCAITGESAVGLPYGFWSDIQRNVEFDMNAHVEKYYTGSATNFFDVFNSPEDMTGLQQLVDQHLQAKTYRDIKMQPGAQS